MTGIKLGFVLLTFLTFSLSAYSQKISGLKNELDSLNQNLRYFSIQIDSLVNLKETTQKQISIINREIETLELGGYPETKIEVKAKVGAKIRRIPKSNGEILKDLSIGEVFFVTNFYENNFLGATSDGIVGYVSKNAIEYNQEVQNLINYHNSEQSKIDEEELKALQKTNPKLADLIRRFGKENGFKIFENKYWIGMTSRMARESLGNPIKINSSSGSWGNHEQWVYKKGLYLYFENGLLKSYQR